MKRKVVGGRMDSVERLQVASGDLLTEELTVNNDWSF
jgi:hypothetical protein